MVNEINSVTQNFSIMTPSVKAFAIRAIGKKKIGRITKSFNTAKEAISYADNASYNAVVFNTDGSEHEMWHYNNNHSCDESTWDINRN